MLLRPPHLKIDSIQVLHPMIHKLMFIYGDEKLPTQAMEAKSERCLLSHNSIKTESSKKKNRFIFYHTSAEVSPMHSRPQ
ncbi:unnamed protein product [Cuscuta campestris]|uniref:Uncharacterized protein n=1 Tax=Cuscuta campestris TaxID=132261 RepID=A0A484LRH3_9ASTE|nr:unnamed protein product [Cuscuta campestris]